MIDKTQFDPNCIVEKIALGIAVRNGARWMKLGEKAENISLV